MLVFSLCILAMVTCWLLGHIIGWFLYTLIILFGTLFIHWRLILLGIVALIFIAKFGWLMLLITVVSLFFGMMIVLECHSKKD
ncbi:hypothetical protein [Leuconostoc gasicomitatum]|uniref:hypothetical protein n=1 Tax=Leuconostoc gasicomitatum TaxID=115778 RepID=UPI0007DEE6C6|nr:hypothetical protein [Leuconostoc gasicomitatum]CUW17750.1 hypothetical protein PB1E_2001 [Leuconostoc gasicomitatum]